MRCQRSSGSCQGAPLEDWNEMMMIIIILIIIIIIIIKIIIIIIERMKNFNHDGDKGNNNNK